MKYFQEPKTMEELKVQYKKLAMQHHPDRGGSTKAMQDVNAEYEKLFNYFKNIHNQDPKNKENQKTESATMYQDLINQIITLDGIEVEICGTWVWISGNTKEHKEILKKAQCCWAKQKLMWYYRSEEHKSTSRRSMSIDDIRAKYGSEKVGPRPPKPKKSVKTFERVNK